MWKVENNKITLTRGDTPSFKLELSTIDDDGNLTPYVPQEGDRLVFAIKKRAIDPEVWAILDIPTDTMMLTFKQETTQALAFGNYVYEISLNNDADEYHDTFIANMPIIITEELYNG